MENLIKSLGEPIDGNEYILKPINGEWWIEHKHVGSGEPLIQWLKSELRQPPVSGRVCFSSDCFYHDKTTETCVGDYDKCTVKQTHR